jgi:hypothetical protein
MRTWLPTLAALALVGAMSGGPAAGEERTSAAPRPLRVRVMTWKTTADGKRDLAPVAGANVVVRPRDGVVDLAAGRTGADGVVRLDVARQRRGYSLQATFAGLGMQCRQLDDEWLDTHDQPAEVRIEPASGLSLGGRVVDVATGRPIAGARVFENDVNPARDRPLPQTSTGTDGTFLFEGLRSPNGAFVYDGITTGGRVEGRVARGLVEVAVAAPGYVLVSRVV